MTPEFDEIVHAPHRLRICAFLDATSAAEFSALRDFLDVADSVVSKQLKILRDAGYITLTKPTGRGRVRTWVSLTADGRNAYNAHIAALKQLVDVMPDMK